MNYTFSGFSKAGNAVVRGAIAAAQDMGHTYVGTEHLLLALVRDDTGEAAAFLLERQVYGYQVGRLLREQVGWCSLAWSPPPRQRNAAGAWASSRCSSRRPGP